MSEPPVDPGPSTPDGADWTWVLTRPCRDCGFDAAATDPADVPTILRDAARSYAARLGRAVRELGPGRDRARGAVLALGSHGRVARAHGGVRGGGDGIRPPVGYA